MLLYRRNGVEMYIVHSHTFFSPLQVQGKIVLLAPLKIAKAICLLSSFRAFVPE
jgi:hypothetical protein